MAKTIAVIPDTQCKYGQDFTFLSHVGNFLVEKKPDYWVQLGDFVDMESLSSYDQGKKSFEGKRYVKDIEAAKQAMDALLDPLRDFNSRAKKNKEKQYKPRLVLCLGNHEERIERAVNSDPKLEGLIQYTDLPYGDWEVHKYLDVVQLEGVCFSHYFTSGVMGRPVPNARQLVAKKHLSCVQGHVQKYEIYNEYRADGKMITGLFAGCCYEHDEDYLGAQGNNYFRGIHMLYEVEDGEFHTHSITLDYLKKKYKEENAST
jgi:hypothetical protein